jgi:hypothetical protein
MKCAERLYGLHADIPGKNQPGEVGEFTRSMRYDLISQVSKPMSSDSKGFVGSLIERAASLAAIGRFSASYFSRASLRLNVRSLQLIALTEGVD